MDPESGKIWYQTERQHHTPWSRAFGGSGLDGVASVGLSGGLGAGDTAAGLAAFAASAPSLALAIACCAADWRGACEACTSVLTVGF